MSDICEWFTQYIDLAEDVVIIKFSDGTTKTVKRGVYLKEVEDNIRKMLIDQVKDRPTGHWEWVQYDSNPNIGNWHCSECGSIVIECVSKEKKGGIPLYKYCPQCGARIKEGD